MTLIIVLSLLAAAAAGGAFYYANKREIESFTDSLPKLDPATPEPTPEPATVTVTDYTEVTDPQEVKVKPPRTRAARGRFQADDPATPNVNEAFVGGVSPKKLRKLPADYELEQMKKSEIAELALQRGLALDLKKTKAQMIAELKAHKPAKVKKQ